MSISGSDKRFVVESESGQWQPVQDAKKPTRTDTAIRSVVARLDYLKSHGKGLEVNELARHHEQLTQLQTKVTKHIQKEYASMKGLFLIGRVFAWMEGVALQSVSNKFNAIFERLNAAKAEKKAAPTIELPAGTKLPAPHALLVIDRAKNKLLEHEDFKYSRPAQNFVQLVFKRIAQKIEQSPLTLTQEELQKQLQDLSQKLRKLPDLLHDTLEHLGVNSTLISDYFELLQNLEGNQAAIEKMGKEIDRLLPKDLKDRYRALI